MENGVGGGVQQLCFVDVRHFGRVGIEETHGILKLFHQMRVCG